MSFTTDEYRQSIQKINSAVETEGKQKLDDDLCDQVSAAGITSLVPSAPGADYIKECQKIAQDPSTQKKLFEAAMPLPHFIFGTIFDIEERGGSS